MSIDDHGLEALRKSAELISPPSKAETQLRVRINNSNSQPIPIIPSPRNLNVYDSISAIPADSKTNIVTYTVPIGKTLLLDVVEFSGENVATYEVTLGGVLSATHRTYFGGGLSNLFLFNLLEIPQGDSVVLRVEHYRTTMNGDFEGRILGVLQDD